MAHKLSYAERLRIPASKPVVNVWNLRMEKMAADRAAQSSSDPFVVTLSPPVSWPAIDNDHKKSTSASSSTHSPTKSNPREKIVFGSIHAPPLPDLESEEERKVQEIEKETEKKKSFAIGVENGHDLPARSRPVQKKTTGRTSSGRPPSLKDKTVKKDKEDDPTPNPSKLSNIEPRWTFGTTSMPSPSSQPPSPSILSHQTPKLDHSSANTSPSNPPFTQPISGSTTPLILEPVPPAPSNIPSIPIPPLHPYHVHLPRIHSPAHPPLPPPLSIPIQVPLSVPPSSSSDPDLEVKDFGFGFGDASGLGYAPIIAKERAREWEAERARERAAAETGDLQPLGFNSEDVISSPLTETSIREAADKDNTIHDQTLPRDHTHPREHHLGRGRRGFPNPRGGYNDRGLGGFRRPRGSINGFPRGFGRGGAHYGGHHSRGGPDGISPVNARGGPSSPFNATPPHHFQTLPLDSSGAPPLATFYHPHPHHPNPGRPYIPPGYEAFNPSPTIAGVPPPLPVDPAGVVLGQPQTHQPHLLPQMLPSGKLLTPPVPVPKTTISFPLDSTRYYLLGQLEYYLSAENMAQDFYLRQQMDARGWIPISLIASFNRVRQLTQDVQLVKDVLYLSSLVQVRGNMVRMGGWEPFVLPDAAPSTVEEQPLPYPYQNLTNYYYSEDAHASAGADVNGELGAIGYPELLHATPSQHHYHSADSSGGGDVYHGGSAITKADGSMVNGHVQEVDDDDEDEVEIVMGQGVGTFMYDPRTASS